MHPTIWKASGHVDAFNDPLIDNKDSKKRYRADVLIEDHLAKIEEKMNKEVAKAAPKPKPAPEKPAGAEEPKGFWGKLKAKLRARREERKRKKAAAKEAKRPKKETAPRRKAKLTLNILVTILRGAGRLTKAVFGSLRVTKIRVCLGVRGEDPAEAARAYGRLNAWLYSSLGVIDRFVYLDFDELRILPDFGSAEPTVADRVSFHLSARLLFIVAAALRVLYEFWREKVLDVFL